jgi:hypothetical protein
VTRKKLVVVAGDWDLVARSFVQRHADRGACLMTPLDLSQAGWSYRVGSPSDSTAMIAGRPLRACDIAGVQTRLPCVTARDLPHIALADRAYVAEEMTAFLLAWLTELERPALNPPTPQCLTGPYWPQEKWVHTAAQLGIATAPSHRRIRLPQDSASVADPDRDGAAVTIVGRREIGNVDRALSAAARRLADAARAALLVVRFSSREPGARFLGASHWADLGEPEIAEAVLQWFRNAKRSRRASRR